MTLDLPHYKHDALLAELQDHTVTKTPCAGRKELIDLYKVDGHRFAVQCSMISVYSKQIPQ